MSDNLRFYVFKKNFLIKFKRIKDIRYLLLFFPISCSRKVIFFVFQCQTKMRSNFFFRNFCAAFWKQWVIWELLADTIKIFRGKGTGLKSIEVEQSERGTPTFFPDYFQKAHRLGLGTSYMYEKWFTELPYTLHKGIAL